jgi:hypothetical protein
VVDSTTLCKPGSTKSRLRERAKHPPPVNFAFPAGTRWPAEQHQWLTVWTRHAPGPGHPGLESSCIEVQALAQHATRGKQRTKSR